MGYNGATEKNETNHVYVRAVVWYGNQRTSAGV